MAEISRLITFIAETGRFHKWSACYHFSDNPPEEIALRGKWESWL